VMKLLARDTVQRGEGQQDIAEEDQGSDEG
jgi:hypothetical protein